MVINKPLVSVIIPTYKRSDSLVRAIESVLNQTYTDVEVIVVDDNNDDEFRKITAARMEQFSNRMNVYYVQHECNKNGSAARNTGISYANGDFIAFLDDDDVFLPQKIEKQYNRLLDLPVEWGGCYCGYSVILDDTIIYNGPHNDIREGSMIYELMSMSFSFGTTSTLFFRKEALINIAGFDESFTRHQDWELMLRFFEKYKLAYVDEILLWKYDDSRINRPKSDEIISLKEKYLNNFKYLIDRMTAKEQSEVLKRHHMELVKACLLDRNFSVAYQYILKLTTLTYRDYILIFLALIEGFIQIRFLIRGIQLKIKKMFKNLQLIYGVKSRYLNGSI